MWANYAKTKKIFELGALRVNARMLNECWVNAMKLDLASQI